MKSITWNTWHDDEKKKKKTQQQHFCPKKALTKAIDLCEYAKST